jgi:putative GTP pyrophosphokinase
MSELQEMRTFMAEYGAYADQVLNMNLKIVKALLKSWTRPEHWESLMFDLNPSIADKLPTPSPVQRVRVRVKRPESVVDKIFRKPDSFPNGLRALSFKDMQDTLGARVVVYFLQHLPLIDREICGHPNLEVSTTSPPIAYLPVELCERLALHHVKRETKESGYASIHYIVRLKDPEISEYNRPWFEIQVRTIAEDAWSEIEHILGYKPGKHTSMAVRKQFQIISKQLSAIDEHFNFLGEELTRFQSEGEARDQDPLNAENLPGVLADLALSCAQKEIDGLLKVAASRGVASVGDLRRAGTPSKIDLVRHTYLNAERRQPNNFELVANLANIASVRDTAAQEERIRAEIEFLKLWVQIKNDMPTKRPTEQQDELEL